MDLTIFGRKAEADKREVVTKTELKVVEKPVVKEVEKVVYKNRLFRPKETAPQARGVNANDLANFKTELTNLREDVNGLKNYIDKKYTDIPINRVAAEQERNFKAIIDRLQALHTDLFAHKQKIEHSESSTIAKMEEIRKAIATVRMDSVNQTKIAVTESVSNIIKESAYAQKTSSVLDNQLKTLDKTDQIKETVDLLKIFVHEVADKVDNIRIEPPVVKVEQPILKELKEMIPDLRAYNKIFQDKMQEFQGFIMMARETEMKARLTLDEHNEVLKMKVSDMLQQYSNTMTLLNDKIREIQIKSVVDPAKSMEERVQVYPSIHALPSPVDREGQKIFVKAGGFLNREKGYYLSDGKEWFKI